MEGRFSKPFHPCLFLRIAKLLRTFGSIMSKDFSEVMMQALKGTPLKVPFNISKELAIIIKALADNQAVPVAVGGCVRDHLLGLQPKDVDIEVYGINLARLEE